MARGYSDEQINWLKKNAIYFSSYRNLRKVFNERFGCGKSTGAIQQFVTRRLDIHLVTDKLAEHFSDEETKWLIDNYSLVKSYVELTYQFNDLFDRNKSRQAIYDKCSLLGLSGMPNSGRFKPGNVKEQCPIGTVRTSTNGNTYIKVKDSQGSKMTGYSEPYWLPIQKKIWQDHFGEVPEGKMIIFLDGNHENLELDNLYCIDRHISACMASNGWYTNSKDHTRAAIMLCELLFGLKDSVERKGLNDERNII